MAERTSVTQLLQLGVESTEGTGVAANRLMPSWQLQTKLAGDATESRPNGFKFPTLEVIGKDYTEATINATQPTYDELPYMLASLLQYTAPVQQGATTAYLWTHAPSSSAEDTRKTYTIEQGSALRAHKFVGAFFHAFNISGDRSKVEVTAEAMGRLLSDAITLTATPTAVPLVPLQPKEADVYLDTTSAGLGGTKLTRVLHYELDIQDTKGPLWVVDSSKPSFAASVEMPIEATLKLRQEADAEGMAALTDWRAGGLTKFARLKFTSANLAGTAFPYSATFDMAVQVAEPPSEFTDEDGVYAIEWTYKIVHDTTWGKALTAAVMNKTTTP